MNIVNTVHNSLKQIFKIIKIVEQG